MISYERFTEFAMDTADTFPEDFFRELNGGVMVREESRLHPDDLNHDLFVLGEYRRDRYLGRFVVLYYGSFERCFGYYREDELKKKIRQVLLHEFRHHLESLAGERDLEVEDEMEISQYKSTHRMQKDLTDDTSGDKIDQMKN